MEIIYKGNSIAGGGLSVLSMTKAEYLANQAVYDASDNIIEITDDDDLAISGEQIAFDNTGTGLTSDDVDGAIKEVNTSTNIKNSTTSALNSAIINTDSPTNSGSTGTIAYYKKGTEVTLQIDITGSALNGVAIYSLPTGYKPYSNIKVACGAGATNTVGELGINSSGSINAYTTTGEVHAHIKYDVFN